MIPSADCLSPQERAQMQKLLDLQKRNEGRKVYFEDALSIIFPGADCYYYKPDEKFLIFVPYRETEYNKERLRYLCYYFFEITAKFETYWEYPFGIIGRAKTMRLNCMKIYGLGKDC